MDRKVIPMNPFSGREWRLRYGDGLVDTVGAGGNGPNGESSVDIDTLPCVKQTASGKLLYSTGCSAQGSVMT